MNNYLVDILTPEKVLARSIPAESLLVPTERGQINVLKDHTHIISKITPGVVSVFGGADDPDRYFSVTVGICKILDNRIIILANTAEESRDVDVERAEMALKTAEEKLSSSDNLDDEEIEKYRRKAERAKLRIQMSAMGSAKPKK
jgi:F-type H+-transporting ATPase subunit epsilon